MKVSIAIAAIAAALALAVGAGARPNAKEVISTLKGSEVVPGPGAKKGTSQIFIIFKPGVHKLCFTFAVKKLDTMTEGDISKAVEGASGPQKVTLFESQRGIAGTGSYNGCVAKVKPSLMSKILASPESYYVEYHTLDFPDGAIRGQLALPPPAPPH